MPNSTLELAIITSVDERLLLEVSQLFRSRRRRRKAERLFAESWNLGVSYVRARVDYLENKVRLNCARPKRPSFRKGPLRVFGDAYGDLRRYAVPVRSRRPAIVSDKAALQILYLTWQLTDARAVLFNKKALPWKGFYGRQMAGAILEIENFQSRLWMRLVHHALTVVQEQRALDCISDEQLLWHAECMIRLPRLAKSQGVAAVSRLAANIRAELIHGFLVPYSRRNSPAYATPLRLKKSETRGNSDTMLKQAANGRFTAGNKLGRGNPLAGRAAQIRAVLLAKLTEKEAGRIADQLIKQARSGDLSAIRELLDRTIGRPGQQEILERLEQLENQIQANDTKKL